MNPPYQRISVWDREKQQRYIDSVINGFDIPNCIFMMIPLFNSQSGKYSRYAVIDGKQRLQALWDFMLEKITLPNDFIFL
jgi:uncharacterized protein with ParB-like and HNH nuclease domain